MEELNACIQIGELMYRIGKGLTIAMIKAHTAAVMNSTGEMSLKNLTKAAGSNITYLEVDSQDKRAIANVTDALQHFQGRYAVLPDFNLADGKVQLAVDGSRLEAVKAAINSVQASKISELTKIKEKYGTESEKYRTAKEKIADKFPSVRFITADDYFMSRLDDKGNETAEYKEMEEKAKEELGKAKTENRVNEHPHSVNNPAPDSAEEIIKLKKQAVYQEMVRNGEAEILENVKLEVNNINIAGNEHSIYRAMYPDGDHSVVFTESQLVNGSPVLIYDREYHIVSNSRPEKVERKTGKEILKQIKPEKRKEAEVLTKTMAAQKKIAKEAAKEAGRNAFKAAMGTNPAGAALSAAETVVRTGANAVNKIVSAPAEDIGRRNKIR